MSSDGFVDIGLLSPVTAGHDQVVSDAAVLRALVAAEVGLVDAYITVGAADRDVAERARVLFERMPDADLLAQAAASGGNPVIPLVRELRTAAPDDEVRALVHLGATSQDILDTALMLVSRAAAVQTLANLDRLIAALSAFAVENRDLVAAGRTLTQHAVPTTIGLRASTWLRGVRRARSRLADATAALPAQLGGAGGTLAAFVEILGADRAARLPEAYAAAVGLAAPDAPWHTTRWPVTELGDALVQAIDAVGVLAGDVATASRTEIGELAEGAPGGSSAMPQKRNPVHSVLIRSAAIRAPQLGATLHAAAALAVDERPDGAWHAEWPTLRELLRVALGATAHAADLVAGLHVDTDAVARTLAATGGLIVAERLGHALRDVLPKEEITRIVTDAAGGDDLAGALDAALAAAGVDPAAALPPGGVAALVDPANYTGLAGRIVDAATAAAAIDDAATLAAAGPDAATLADVDDAAATPDAAPDRGAP